LNSWRQVILKVDSNNADYSLYACSSYQQPAMDININGEQILYGGSKPHMNNWTHLAATYDGAMQRLYVNGILAASRSQIGSIVTSNGIMSIGGNSILGEYFTGIIDEVRIYNGALSLSQIQTDMNTPLGSTYKLDKSMAKDRARTTASKDWLIY
jgi:hypothetical protein